MQFFECVFGVWIECVLIWGEAFGLATGAAAPFFVGDDFEGAVEVFDDGGHGFDPVAGVEVVDVADFFIGRGVDVTADDAVAFFGIGEVLQLFFVFADEADGAFDFGFDPFGEGEGGFAAPVAIGVVDAVDFEEGVVADGAEFRHPFVVGGDVVEAVAVDDEVVAVGGLVDVFVGDFEVIETQGLEAFDDIVVVAAQVDDFGGFFVHFFEDGAHEVGVIFGPFAVAFEGPGVDDVAIEDEFFARGVADEVAGLGGFALRDAEVDVGDKNGFEAEFTFHGSNGLGIVRIRIG